MELLLQNEPDSLQSNNYIAVVSSGPFSVDSNISTAEYQLTPTELKSWFLVIASLKGREASRYTIDSMAFADKLSIDTRKARGSIVRDIFKKLMNQRISIASKEANAEGEQSSYDAYFLSEVKYDRNTKMLTFSIPPTLHEYLFNLKKSLTLSLDIADILQLNTVMSIRVFVYLRELDRVGIHNVPIDEFRRNVNFLPTSPYKAYNRSVIKKSVAEIRRLDGYQDFFIEDDGKPGRKATMLHFGFSKALLEDQLLQDVAPNLRKQLLKKFNRRILILIELAMHNGFNPAYIRDQFDNFDDNYIAANFNVVFERISADRMQMKQKDPDEYGRYFITSVVKNWAGQNREQHAKHAKSIVNSQEMQHHIKEIKHIEDFQHTTLRAREQAKEYVSQMPFDELVRFIDKNKKELAILSARGRAFDRSRALERKKTYREFHMLCQLVAGKMLAGEIKMKDPSIQSLFDC